MSFRHVTLHTGWRNRLAGLVAVVLVAGCGASDSPASTGPDSPGSVTTLPAATTEPATTSSTTTGAPVRLASGLLVPAAWVASSDGVTAAANEADLGVEIPTGPRALVVEQLVDAEAAVARSAEVSAVLEREPTEVDVGGAPGVLVVLRETSDAGSVVRGYVYSLKDGAPIAVLLEAPPPEWDAAWSTLASVIGLAE